MSYKGKSSEVLVQARRHLRGGAAAARARVATMGMLASTALLPSAKAEVRDVNCFLRGTAILTSSGETAVEELRIGDLVETVSGKAQPIRWIGRQVFRRNGRSWPNNLVPIRVARGAIDEHTPHRDLYLAPMHGLFLDGLLISVKELVNGHSIAPAPPTGQEEIEYFHILLERHEVVLAEGAPAETFRPGSNTKQEDFTEFRIGEYERLYPGEPWPNLVALAPVVNYSGRDHLKALLRLAVSRFIRLQEDPVADAYENVYQRLATRAVQLVSEEAPVPITHRRPGLSERGVSVGSITKPTH
jgi:hypothetical protein